MNEKAAEALRRRLTEEQIQAIYEELNKNGGKAKIKTKHKGVQQRRVRFNLTSGKMFVSLFGLKTFVKPKFEEVNGNLKLLYFKISN